MNGKPSCNSFCFCIELVYKQEEIARPALIASFITAINLLIGAALHRVNNVISMSYRLLPNSRSRAKKILIKSR